MDIELADIETLERWLAERAPRPRLDPGCAERIKWRVRAELATLGASPFEAGVGPRPFVVARIKQAVRDELHAGEVRAAPARGRARQIAAWAAGWAALAAAMLAAAVGLQLGETNGPPASQTVARIDIFTNVLDRPADAIEQQLADLADDLAAVEELGMSYVSDSWFDAELDALDDAYDEAESIWDVS